MDGWEQDAVRDARRGRAGAYERLVGAYTCPLDRAVRRIVRDPDQARDVTQQAFLSAFQHLDRFDGRHRFFSWIFRIAVNEALNALRTQRRRRDLATLDPPDPAPSPEERLLCQERSAALHGALLAVPEKYRVVLILHYYLELPYAEIAHLLELPASTVKSRLHTARGLLRRRYERPEEGAGPARGRDGARRGPDGRRAAATWGRSPGQPSRRPGRCAPAP